MTELLRQLDSYRTLEVGWDGYHGETGDRRSLNDAIYFLVRIPSRYPLPEAMIGSDGIAGLFWDIGGLYASIDFTGDHTYCFITDGAEQAGDDGIALEQIHADLAAVLRQMANQ